MNRMALVYVVTRILFDIAYVRCSTRRTSLLRTIVFFGNIFVYLHVIHRSAMAIAAK